MSMEVNELPTLPTKKTESQYYGKNPGSKSGQFTLLFQSCDKIEKMLIWKAVYTEAS